MKNAVVILCGLVCLAPYGSAWAASREYHSPPLADPWKPPLPNPSHKPLSPDDLALPKSALPPDWSSSPIDGYSQGVSAAGSGGDRTTFQRSFVVAVCIEGLN